MLGLLISKQQTKVAEKIMDLGNIAAGAWIFGQAISGNPFNIRVAILGLVVLVIAYWWAIKIIEGGER